MFLCQKPENVILNSLSKNGNKMGIKLCWNDIRLQVLMESVLIDWCLTPKLAVFQLYRGVGRCI